MNKLFDLRFVIGLFFLVVGLLLIAYGFLANSVHGSINWSCGILFTVFAIVMIGLSLRDKADQGSKTGKRTRMQAENAEA